MTGIPQDVRSPIQQSRWVEAYNNTAVTIPAHGVCEVASNSINSTEFRDILYVKRPTAAGLPECVINSCVPIPAGKPGWVTLDLPAYVKGSLSMNTGDMVGTAANDFSLTLGKPGFMVLGAGPGTTGLVRVKPLWEPLIRGTLGADLCPDDSSATVASSWVSRNSLQITTASNIYALAGPSGSDIAMQWDGVLQDWVVLQVEHRIQQIITDISKGSCKINKTYIEKTSQMYCGIATTVTAVEFFEKTFLTDLRLSDGISGSGSGGTGTCALQTNSMTVCVFDNASSYGWTTKVTFEPQAVMVTLRQNGVCLEGYIMTIYVPCASDGMYVNMVCGTTCASGS